MVKIPARLRIYKLLEQLIALFIDGANLLNLVFIFPSLVLLVVSDIVLRTFFESSISWTHEVSGLLLIVLFFLSLPVCLKNNEFLSVDFIYQRLGSNKQVYLDFLKCMFVLMISGIVTWVGIAGSLEAYEYEEQAFTVPIPYWPFYGLVGFVGIIMFVQALLLMFAVIWPIVETSKAANPEDVL